MGETALLSVDGVTKRFGGTEALGDVSFDVGAGRVWGLIGPNGSGKTTMFNCISGFYRLDGGDIRWRGSSVKGISPDRLARMGIVRSFQQVMSFDELTVLECIERAQRLRGSGRGEAQNERVPVDPAELLEMAGIGDSADRIVGSLSYGVQRLVNVVMAAATRPWLILLDEPAAGLHPDESRNLAGVVRTLRDVGTTVFVIDHDVSFVSELCDHVVVLDAGRKLMSGTPAEVRADPRVIEVYLGGEPPAPEMKGAS